MYRRLDAIALPGTRTNKRVPQPHHAVSDADITKPSVASGQDCQFGTDQVQSVKVFGRQKSVLGSIRQLPSVLAYIPCYITVPDNPAPYATVSSPGPHEAFRSKSWWPTMSGNYTWTPPS